MTDDTDTLIVNLVTAARAAGFARGRGENDADANRAEDAALDALRARVAELRERVDNLESHLDSIERD